MLNCRSYTSGEDAPLLWQLGFASADMLLLCCHPRLCSIILFLSVCFGLSSTSTAGDLNQCLAAFDLCGGGVYSIKMELLNHQDGMVIPYRWNNNIIKMEW